MAYVGNQPARGQFRKLSDISGSFNGATTTFTTSVPPGTSEFYVTAGSASQLIVSLGGVIQQPDTDYTVSTNSITFTTAPAAGLSFFGVLLGDALNSATPSDGSITAAKLAGNLTAGFAGGSAGSPSIYFTGDTNTGIYSPGADQVAISTSGAQRVTVDSSGRVLVGTSTARSNFFNTSSFSPSFQLEGTTYSTSMSSIVTNGTAVEPYLVFGRSRGTSVGGTTVVVNNDTCGVISFQGSDGTELVEAASIQVSIDATPGANDMPGRIVLSTTADGASSPTERMRIDSSGRVGIGTTSPTELLSVNGNIWLGNGGGSGGSEMLRIWNDSGVERIHGSNNPSALAFGMGGSSSAFEAFRIDASRRLLVGTSTARQVGMDWIYDSSAGSLLVENAADPGAVNIVRNRNDLIGPYLRFGKSRGTSTGSNTVVQSGDNLGEIQFCGADGTDMASVGGSIRVEVDATPGSNDMPGRLVFSTTADGASSPTERMRITQAGKICMGNSASSQPETLQVYALDSVNGYCILANVAGTGTRTHIRFENGNGMVGAINTNGTTTSYLTSSDYRLKENIAPVQDAVVRLQQLKPCRFNFITDAEVSVDGFIAHEVQEVVPEAISGEKDAVDSEGNPKYQGIDQSKLVPLLTAALQEAIGEIESLKGRVAALETA